MTRIVPWSEGSGCRSRRLCGTPALRRVFTVMCAQPLFLCPQTDKIPLRLCRRRFSLLRFLVCRELIFHLHNNRCGKVWEEVVRLMDEKLVFTVEFRHLEYRRTQNSEALQLGQGYPPERQFRHSQLCVGEKPHKRLVFCLNLRIIERKIHQHAQARHQEVHADLPPAASSSCSNCGAMRNGTPRLSFCRESPSSTTHRAPGHLLPAPIAQTWPHTPAP